MNALETSRERLDVPDRKLARTIGYYAGFIALGLTTASLGPTLPGLAEHTGAHLNEISFLFTAKSLGYLVGSLRGGRWYDRLPGHRVQAAALLLMAGMMALVPVLPLLWVLAAALGVLGFAEGTLDVGANTLLVWVHRERIGPFMNGLHFFFGVGAFLSPIIIAQAVLLSGDITWAYWALALLLLPVIIWVARQPSPSIPAAARAGQAGRVNLGLVVLVAVFFFLNVGAETSFGGWIFTYARSEGLADEVTAAYLTSAFWGALTLGRLLSIPIAARLQPRTILLGDLLGCLASLALILAGRFSYAAAWAGAFGTGLFMASIFPTTITLAGRYLPINGRITGWFFVGGSAGSMFFPWLIGQLFEPFGPPAAMAIIFAAMVLALAVFLFFMQAVGRSQAFVEKVG
jgi:FHS family Na+ dependent glucose MFS transporter 1